MDTHCLMILGGPEKSGFGWNTFVKCLAEGRGVAALQQESTVVDAYARIRKQFRVPIAEFRSIHEALASAGSDG